MALRARVFTAGKLLVLSGALVSTYVVSAVVSMRIALKTREVEVPDLADRTANDATSLAAGLGLTIRVDDNQRPDPKVAAGRVLLQDPPPHTIARRQRSVRVWLSAGQRASRVPPLTGESQRTAELRLAQDGLSLAAVSEIRSDVYGSDVVVAQDPPANDAAPAVALLVNRAQRSANYVMPDLIGVHGERAADLLRNHGFRVATVGSTPYPGVAAGIVIRQSPPAGFQIAPGEPISIEVSR